jgi:hypothetical protein
VISDRACSGDGELSVVKEGWESGGAAADRGRR